MLKYKKCDNFCDYENYYVNQASGKYPTNLVIQRGTNWFTSFAKRFGFPALKFLGKQVYETGKDIVRDVIEGKSVKQAAKSNIKKGVSKSLKDLSEKMQPQTGTSRKRKRTKNKVKNFQKRKIFNKKIKPRKKRGRRKQKRKDIFN